MPVSAQAEPPALGTSASGLRGLRETALPLGVPQELSLGLGVGYGLTESVGKDPGAHHRGSASLGLAYSPLNWLAFALRLDGRLEFHPDDGDGAHVAGFGDPRLLARVGHALGRDFSIGFEAAVWFPGTDAPSIIPSATSLEARALGAFVPAGSGWTLLANTGYRLDNSAHAAPDLSRLRFGDRISLGLSDSDAVLLALGVARKLGSAAELFGELSGDVLIGSDSPGFASSPLRGTLGGRYFWADAWQAELSVIGSFSQRPDAGARDPLVVFEPRVRVLAGLRYAFRLGESAQPAAGEPKPAEPGAALKTATDPASKSVAVSGTVVDEAGQPLPEAQVVLRDAGGVEREAITDGLGNYGFESVPLGPATLEVRATGYKQDAFQVDVQPDLAPLAARTLAPSAETGILRGLIRSWKSEPLRAQIVVRDRRSKTVASRPSGDDGRFEIDLPPGSYNVTISAEGYQPHTRTMKIDGNGVSILNVDMRERRR